MHILIVAEHDNHALRPASLSAVQFARELTTTESDQVEILILGHELQALTEKTTEYAPAIVADHEQLEHPLADRLAMVIAETVRTRNVDILVAANSSWARDVVSRAAGLLGGRMASDVVGCKRIDGILQFQRPMFAGSLNATVVLHGSPKIIAIRPSAYPQAKPLDQPATNTQMDVTGVEFPVVTHFEGLKANDKGRPDANEARVVVSGGRALNNADEYERLVGILADQMNGATGCSRPLVDEGIIPNEFQIGQTGKIVAPDLYVALGISGAIQHLAGMTNSKTIVAVNQDPEAPIFKYADYGIVGDLFEVVPEMIAEVEKLKAIGC